MPGRVTKPPIVKASHAGSCYICGLPIHVGDKIRITVDKTYTPEITKAAHKECYP